MVEPGQHLTGKVLRPCAVTGEQGQRGLADQGMRLWIERMGTGKKPCGVAQQPGPFCHRAPQGTIARQSSGHRQRGRIIDRAIKTGSREQGGRVIEAARPGSSHDAGQSEPLPGAMWGTVHGHLICRM